MENIINFKKDINFDTAIYEINELNIDYQYNVLEDTIKGNYIITGTYKDSEIKIGSESFNYQVPFTIELDNNVNLDTITFNISDFDYEINNHTLSLNINNLITYDENNDVIFDEMDDLYRDDETDDDDDEELIINDEEEDDNHFVKYQVHYYLENESLEDICGKYHITKETLIKYNKDDINPGAKLIIPNED